MHTYVRHKIKQIVTGSDEPGNSEARVEFVEWVTLIFASD